MKNEIIKNNKGSYKDFGLTIKSKSIGSPKKKKIKEEVPFMNGSYDFSNLYGEQSYDERELTYIFNVVGSDKIDMNILKIQVVDWLMEGGKVQLYDNAIPGFYFLAECEDISFSEKGRVGELTVKFIAYPFKYGINLEGADIWDDFNFEIDYAQEVEFNVVGTKDIEIYNPSAIKITPTVICDAEFSIIQGSTTYIFNTGTTRDWRFSFKKGINNLILNGTGNIKFEFRKEVL